MQIRNTFSIVILLIMAFSLQNCSDCSDKKKKKTQLEHIKKSLKSLNEIEKNSDLSRKEMEALGVALIDIQRECTKKYTLIKKSNICSEKKQKAYLAKRKIPFEKIADIQISGIALKWELKHFLKKRKVDISTLKTVYSKCMAHFDVCDKKIRKLKISETKKIHQTRRCSDKGVYLICKKHAFNRSECERIISMGVDYGWKIHSRNKKAIKINTPTMNLKKPFKNKGNKPHSHTDKKK